MKFDWHAHVRQAPFGHPGRAGSGRGRLLLALFLLAQTAVARDLVILATPEEPYKFVENGVHKGIDIEVIDEVMRRLGLSYSVELIESGHAHPAGGHVRPRRHAAAVLQKPERMDFLLYPQESYIDISWSFFIRAADEGNNRIRDFADLAGLQIGITQDFSYTPEFLEFRVSVSRACRETRSRSACCWPSASTPCR